MKFILAWFLMILPISSWAATGIYAGLAAGMARQSGLPSVTAANATTNAIHNFPAIRADIGYLHDFNPTFGIGIEVGRGYYGNTDYNLNSGEQINVKTVATDFLFVTAYHVKKIDVIGKIGGNRNTATFKRSVGTSDEECRIQLVLMAELAYNFNSHVAATTSYLHAFGNTITNLTASRWQAPGINAVLLGLRVTFW